MEIGPVHQTALGAARMRALHLLVDGSPKIFVDEFAIRLTGDDTAKLIAERRPQIQTVNWVLRSRYTEDLLAAAVTQGVAQYVILGAGLDSFVYRNAESLGALRVYEVDDPPLQAWKRHRLAELGIRPPPQCMYVPCDFESQSLQDALHAARFNPALPTFVAWLGVTQYLTRAAINATLQWAAGLAPRSELVLTYVVPAGADDSAELALREVIHLLRASGVPFDTFYSPDEIEAALLAAGLVDVRHLTLDDANARYFSGRTDTLRAPGLERLVSAKVGRG